MKKFRLIFFLIYGGFHLALLGFSFYADYLYKSNNIKDLLKLSGSIPYARWMSIFGITLFFINLIIFFWVVNKKDRRIKFLEQERSDYKEKMFNLEHKEEDIPEE